MVYNYMIKIYAFLVKADRKQIEDLPLEYQIPVAEYLTTEWFENTTIKGAYLAPYLFGGKTLWTWRHYHLNSGRLE